MLKSNALRIGIALLLLVFGLMLPASAQTPVVVTATPAEPVVNLNEAAQDAVNLTEGAAETTIDAANSLFARIVRYPQSQVVRLLFVIGGALLLVAGWWVYDFVILIAGFLIGAAFAVALVPDTNSTATIAAFIIGGLLGGALSYFVYYIAVFLIGAYVGILIMEGLAQMMGVASVNPILLLIVAVIAGMVLLGLSVELLVLLSALVGAQLLALGLGLGTEWVLILTVVGVIIQLVAARAFNYSIRRPIRRRYFSRRRAAI